MKTLFYKNINIYMIIMLCLAYGAILSFPVFGSVLIRSVGVDKASILGSIFFVPFTICFLFKPLKIEKNKKFVTGLLIIATILTILFPIIDFTFQIISIIIVGMVFGRYVVLWSYLYFKSIEPKDISKVMCIILFVSYFILYLSNVLVPSIPKSIVGLWPGILLIGMCIIRRKFNNDLTWAIDTITESSDRPSLKYLIPITLVYITAGVTYTGIYPSLQIYMNLERYYNVLPFLLVMPLILFLSDKFGRKTLLFSGVGLLGISFVSNIMPLGILTYLLIQSFLQMGWAFLDAYVWIFSSDIAKKNNTPMYINYGAASFLFGTFLGSLITTTFRQPMSNETFVFNNIITYLPLFISMLLISILPETLHLSIHNSNTRCLDDMFSKLTPREKEVAALLGKNYKGKDICDRLNISNNTLKTHSRNIYRKMNVSNKIELVKLISK